MKRSLYRSKQRKSLAQRQGGVVRETGGAQRMPFPKLRGSIWSVVPWEAPVLAGYRLLWHCSSSEVVERCGFFFKWRLWPVGDS